MCRFTSRSSSGRRQSDTTANKTTVTICSRAIEACGSAFSWVAGGAPIIHVAICLEVLLKGVIQFGFRGRVFNLDPGRALRRSQKRWGGACWNERGNGTSKNELTSRSNLKLSLFTVPSHHLHNDLHFIIYSSFKSTPLSFSMSSSNLVYCRESILE